MADGPFPGTAREFRISRFDQRIADWLDIVLPLFGMILFISSDARGALALKAATVITAISFTVSLKVRLSRTSCFLSDRDLIIGQGRDALTMGLEGLKVEVKDDRGIICLQSSGGRRVTLHGAGKLDSDRLVVTLSEAGAEIIGRPFLEKIKNIHDFELESPLTDAVNWRWQDCRSPDLALEAVIGSTNSQTVRVKDERLTLLRKGRVVATFALKDLILVRQVKEADPAAARLILKSEGKNLWPLSDWDSPVETKLFAALTALGLPVEEQQWVRRMEWDPAWQ